MPQVEVGTLQLLRHERIELERRAEAGAHLVLVLDFEQRLRVRELVHHVLSLAEHVVALHGALATVEARRHALVGPAARRHAALAARLQQSLQRAVAVERHHVEQ